MTEIVFTSSKFPVVPHEDEGLNPGILGRSVADWIKATLSGTKFAITEDIDEDFGHCLVVHRKPYLLWVGCGGFSDHDYPEGGLDENVAAAFPLETIEWRIWVVSELGLMSKLLRRDRRADDKAALLELLKARLSELPHVVIK